MADQLRVVFDGAQLQDATAVGGGTVMGSRLPGVYTEIVDYQLGVIPQSAGMHIKIGTAARGEVGRVYKFSDVRSAQAVLGAGALLEAAEVSLRRGVSLYCLRAPASIAGSIEPLRAASTNVGSGSAALSGDATASYDVRLEVVRGGTVAAGDAQLRYSLDGGKYWSGTYSVVAELALADTGLRIAFDTGDLVAGDRYQAKVRAPQMSLADLMAAFDALAQQAVDLEFIHVVGAVTVSSAEAVKARVQALNSEGHRALMYVLETRGFEASDYPSGMESFDYATATAMERNQVRANYIANLAQAWQGFYDPDCMLYAGEARIIDASALQAQFRNVAWLGTPEMAGIPIAEDLGRVARGAVTAAGALTLDERLHNGLWQAGFNTMRSYGGTSGSYFTMGVTRAPAGSDFYPAVHRRLCNAVKRFAYFWLLRYVNASFPLNLTTGFLADEVAATIDAEASRALEAAFVDTGNASRVQARLDRSTPIIPEGILMVTVAVTPLGYSRRIMVKIALSNPALALVEATTSQESQDEGVGNGITD